MNHTLEKARDMFEQFSSWFDEPPGEFDQMEAINRGTYTEIRLDVPTPGAVNVKLRNGLLSVQGNVRYDFYVPPGVTRDDIKVFHRRGWLTVKIPNSN